MNRRDFFAGVLGLAATTLIKPERIPSDYVPAMLTPGEFVIRKKYADLYMSPEAFEDIRNWSIQSLSHFSLDVG